MFAELPYNSDAGVGPTFNSTTYMHYGKFTAVAKAAPKGGAVTAFILIADNRDEIDFEFTGGRDYCSYTLHPKTYVNILYGDFG